jgi:glycosyltransferase involved in cell wall biosynthesis/2-polyprenyl-3-methyl-5-hydroxy-6-metoxy-1,4-benzoquinol methylase
LDFFVDRIALWAGTRSPQTVRVLDIGCGKGNIALPLSEIGYEVTGIDFDAASIEEARDTARDMQLSAVFLEGSFEQLHGRQFDVVIASEVLEHQQDPQAFLDTIRALCAPDALVLFSVPNGKSLEERLRRFSTHTALGRALKRFVKRRIGHEAVQSAAEHPHVQFFSWKELRRVLDAAGYVVSEVTPAAAWFKEWFYVIGRLMVRRGSVFFHACDRLDAAMAPYLPRSVADGWLLETRLRDPHRPRVLHILPALAAGGAERVVYELARHLPQHGYDVRVMTLFSGGPLESLFREARIPLTVPTTSHSWIAAFRACRQVIDQERPRIVHTHLFGADVIGRLVGVFLGVPILISTEHSINVDHGWVKRFVKAVLAPITQLFIAVSAEAKIYMAAHEGIPERRVQVIHNGIDVQRIVPRPRTPFHDVPRLVTVGRLMPQKDHATLLQALARVTLPWRLEIVGEGEYEAELRALAERLGISSRITWRGYRTDIPQILAASDIFCFPSRWEGLGLALMEAAAAGIPIIASDLPVFHEIVSTDEVVFVPTGYVEAWAEAVEDALRHPHVALRRAEQVEERIRLTCSVEQMVAAYAQAYHTLSTHSSV